MDLGNGMYRMALSIAISLLFDLSVLFGLTFVFTIPDAYDTSTQQYGPLFVESFHETSSVKNEMQKRVPEQQAKAEPVNVEKAETSIAEEVKMDDMPQTIQDSRGTTLETPVSSSTEIESASTTIKEWLYSQISQHLVYPPIARKRSIEGTSRISFTIDPAGHLVSISLDTSAGSVILDHAALDLVKSMFPIPEALCTMHNTISFTIDITYSLK